MGVYPEHLQRVLRLAPEVMCEAATLEEAKKQCVAAAPGSAQEQAAFNRWVEFCSTTNEIQGAYYDDLTWCVDKRAAFEKWNAVSMSQVKDADTVEKAKIAFASSPPSSEAQDAALIKSWELYQKEN